jgi:hypothetical protein
MKSWYVARNTLYKKASVDVEEGPWWTFFIAELSNLICHYMLPIPFPPIGKIRIAKEDRKFFDKEEYNLREYYGGLKGWWHSYIDDPIFFWAYRKIKRHSIKIPYNRHRTITKEFNIKWR